LHVSLGFATVPTTENDEAASIINLKPASTRRY
jgi:hypothetical protein